MSDYIAKLKEIGAQKIHETTHISKQHAQAIVHGSFEGMSKLQFLGFISIIEREYALDLTQLREKAEEYFSGLHDDNELDEEAKNMFRIPQRKKNYTPIYIIIVVIVFIAMLINSSFEETTLVEKNVTTIDNNNIEIAKNVIDLNETLDKNETQEIADLNITVAPVKIDTAPTSFKILPNVKVWLGYINLTDNKKAQKVFRDELKLDPKKDWLLVFGHGNINIELNGDLKSYNNKNKLRFLYKDGVLKSVTYSEFKALNKGKSW